MRASLLLAAALAIGASSADAQIPKPSLAKKLKGALKGAVDSAATQATAAVIDTMLGTGATRLADGSCPPGTSAAGATVGAAVVEKVKEELGPESARPAPPPCLPAGLPGQQASAAAMEQAALEAQARAQAPAGSGATAATAASAMGAVAAATPVGLAVGAAPVAAKALGGLFGKGQTRESMIKDLSKGRLELKAVRFIGASDALEDEAIDDDLAKLAEALQAIAGDFVLNLPAEAENQAEPDTVMARRRLTKLTAHLALAGLGDRLELTSGPPGLDPKRKAPKIGGARVEVLRKPAPEQR